MNSGVLTAFFSKREDARRAFRKLDRREFRRLALIYKTEEGVISIHDRFLWHRIFGTVFSAILFILLLGGPILLIHLTDTYVIKAGFLYPFLIVIAGIGAFVGWFFANRSRLGINPDLPKQYARSLMPGESLLIIQAPVDAMQIPVQEIRDLSDPLPSIFILHSSQEKRRSGRDIWVAMSREQIKERALYQAIDHHQLSRETQRNPELLKRVKRCRKWIQEICRDLAVSCRLEQGASPVAEWIIDNEFIVASTARDVLQNLPQRYYRELPTISGDPYLEGMPFIYGLAKELVADTELRLDRDNILSFLMTYQSIRTLSTAELWAIPQMLRIALVESIQSIAITTHSDLCGRQHAALWANRLIAAARKNPEHISSLLGELDLIDPNPYFCTQLIDHLYDEESVLVPVEEWIEKRLDEPLSQCALREQNRQSKAQISISNVFTSLRQLNQFDWREIFEKVSSIEKILRFDPAGVYATMDFETRDRYRQVVEDFALRTGQPEEDIAHCAIELATEAVENGAVDERMEHVGTYLIGEKRGDLAQTIHCREPFRCQARDWLKRDHTLIYSTSVGVMTALFITIFLALGLPGASLSVGALFVLLSVIPASQMAVQVANFFVTHFISPRVLPKMDFEETGIPDELRTLVVVPTLLANVEMLRHEVEKLEIRYMANREENLVFGLFTDYTDCTQPLTPGDKKLLKQAVKAIESLNKRHGEGRFLLFHRERIWSESEQVYIGKERKRGKLEELNQLLVEQRPEDAERLIYAGDAESLQGVRFVITLDSDTQLPHGTARRMIETLAHPLNRPRLDNEGQVCAGSYTIIQPRVSPSLTSVSGSSYSRFFGDAVGVDPYTKAVSDVYQDLTGQGSYHGKGIYDVRAFHNVLGDRFPEERILSHDLIEGEYVRTGLASDIELYDEFPQSYQSDSGRLHRWIRGDWQIARWVLPSVPVSGGEREGNTLSLFSRWKIFDNLRRSLLPASSVFLLFGAWSTDSRIGLVATLAVVLQVFFHPLAQLHATVTSRVGLKSFSPARMVHNISRSAVEAALLPHQAIISLDAICRSWYRCTISKRRLLEWTSAQMNSAGPRIFTIYLFLVSPLSLLLGMVVFLVQPGNFPTALPFLLLWFLSPALVWMLSREQLDRDAESPLEETDLRFLRTVSRRTWRYFSEFVNDQTSWLPPDNYQVSHQDMLAMRTSPTNIGLWMLSAQAAQDSGYISPPSVIEKLSRTMETIEKLERHEGHLLNWYDIGTLNPLEPRYVSSVDSGNLLGSLWVLEHGLSELLASPLVDEKLVSGLWDTTKLFQQTCTLQQLEILEQENFDQLLEDCAEPQTSIADMMRLFRRCDDRVTRLIEKMPSRAESDPESESDSGWLEQLRIQLDDWRPYVDGYLGWAERLGEKSDEEIAKLGLEAVQTVRKDLTTAPSLNQLVSGEVATWRLFEALQTQGGWLTHGLAEWIDSVLAAFRKAQEAARELRARTRALRKEIRQLSESINMGFLYSSERKLFAVGYNVSADRLDNAYYDLLASEARFGSFVAIARGEVPMEHWFSLGRPYGKIGYSRALLSWTGTMFEYLMPVIFQHRYDNSLLDRATRQAVAEQINYARKHRIPWGMSESAYGDLDLNKTYQYKAFGVPTLGLKRILKNQLVVAPYATLLSVSIFPVEVVQNLRRLKKLGMLKTYGYYESIDFSRRIHPSGKRGVIIKAYMAHHQGMGFLALTNYLHGNPMQRRFHADARVRAFELLLQERVPALPPLHLVSARDSVPKVAGVGEVSPNAFTFETPNTPIPKSQFLSNGRYDVMVTNSGGGYSQWGGSELNRWRVDRTSEQWGSFCYIADEERGKLWSNMHLPTAGSLESYSVEFPLDRAIFRREENGIHSETVIVVSPEDDVEIRRMTLANRSGRKRRLSLTSYIELSMAPHRADLQHPAFNKLFIETEAVSEEEVLLAYRRPRSEDAEPLFMAHRFTCEQGGKDPFSFETDRRRFIGRGRSLQNPQGGLHPLENTQGFVLDPIFSLRQSIELMPNQHVQVSMIVAAGKSREDVLQLMRKYGEMYAIDRAIDFVWRASQIELRMMHIQPEEARRFRQLADHLLFPNPLLRASEKFIEENHKGQSGLWPYGISGDLPIILISIGEVRDIGLVRQLLQAQAYWLRHGLVADLVILNEESGSYDEPLRERLVNLIQAHSMFIGREHPGGIFLRSVDQLPEEDVRLLKAAASVVLVAARGSLSQQLGVPRKTPDLPGKMKYKSAPEQSDPELPLPPIDLECFNGIGGFAKGGREYVVQLDAKKMTPAPWVNVMANPDFGAVISEAGAGFCWYGNSQRNRLTQWSNDPVIDPPGEILYLRDEENGSFWTPTISPVRNQGAYRTRHGIGYSVFEHNSHGIEQALTVFVPVKEGSGDPVKLQKLTLKNRSRRTRRLTLTSYTELILGENREFSQMHVITHLDEQSQAMLAWNRYHPEYGSRVTFVASSLPVRSFCGDRICFIGRNRTLSDPLAMELTQLACQSGAGLDPCASLQFELELQDGEEKSICLLIGQAESVDEARALIRKYQQVEAVDKALEGTVAWWDSLLGRVEVQTPEPAADMLINRWLLYQSLSCRIWGRSAVYQSGGAFGFRDQLQDVMAFLYTHPELAREQILLAATRQFLEGDVQHWWHPPGGAGIRSRISDDLLWLPFVVAQYVRVTGDNSILEAEATFLNAPELEEDQHEVFAVPEVTFERGTIFDHCQRVVKRGLTSGAMGLPLIGTGDWNDGMNLVGAEGRGESVWLAWFIVDVLKGMSELADTLGDEELAATYLKDRDQLVANIESSCWDGSWYLRATFDDGSPLGSTRSQEARIDSLPQSWAWLTGAADRKRAEQALDSAWTFLVREDEKIVQLFDPPFDKSLPSPGYIKGYPPGVRENGGQYTHAALWFAMALARRGDGERAVQMLRMLNPVEHALDMENVWSYGVEPYVVTADVYRLPGRIGQGGWSWYTGSAAWMYRAWVEEVLGLKVRGEHLWLDPVIPESWDGFSLRYRNGEAEYRIKVENPDHCQKGVLWLAVDGEKQPEGKVTLGGRSGACEVTVRMGK